MKVVDLVERFPTIGVDTAENRPCEVGDENGSPGDEYNSMLMNTVDLST